MTASPRLSTSTAVVSAASCLMVAAVHSGFVAACGALLTTLPLYAFAARTRGQATSEGVRGALIGCNAALNCLAWMLLLPVGMGFGVGLAIGALNLCAAAPALSRRPTYRWMLGRLSWAMPSSWPVLTAGLLFVLVSLLGAGTLGLGGFRAFRLLGSKWEKATGTLFLHGGLIANLNPVRTAFNMGPFAFVHARSADLHLEHEAGHALNLAAFGSVFHLIGAVDENWVGSGSMAFAERLAESNVHGSRSDVIRMWS